MVTRIRTSIILMGVLALTCCKPATVATPEPTQGPVPTSAMVVPMATAATTLPGTPALPGGASTPGIVVRQEGSPMAIVNLQRLQPGHKYRLTITSSAGAVAFGGTWSESAVGANGLPGVKTGLLEGTTPADLDIVPPVASVAKDWVYSAQVSNKAGGSIALTIVDVTP